MLVNMQRGPCYKEGISMTSLYAQIASLGKKYGAQKIILFGSRARGDHRPTSDIDIAVYGMPEKNKGYFAWDVDDLPTLLQFDIVHITDATDPKFLANVEKDGVLLMDKLQKKYTKLCDAVKRLHEALDDYQTTPIASVRDGAIQRFEFCYELAWKTLREYLLDLHVVEGVNNPKGVFREAYANKLIENEQQWVALGNDRNLTSHLYDESTAVAIFERISGQYIKLFDQLIEKLK